jgi:predicted RND superfamily exporter protein
VALGTGQSARVVGAAALIMAAIFVAFIFAPDPTTKEIGFSFAVGVLVDAFAVHLTLVPAAMAILGAKVWHPPAGSPATCRTPTSRANVSTTNSATQSPASPTSDRPARSFLAGADDVVASTRSGKAPRRPPLR